MTEQQSVIKQRIYPELSIFTDPTKCEKIRKAFKCLKKIAVCVEDKEIELNDIMCQNLDEYMVLCEYRKKLNVMQRKMSERAMKKLFH